MTIKEVLTAFDKRIKAEIVSGLDAKGITASGATARSLRGQIQKERYTLFGREFFLSVDFGRGPYRGGPPSEMWATLYEWVGYKKYGITYGNDKERKSITWAIYNKMQRDGSFKFRNKDKRTQVVETAIQKSLPTVTAALANFYTANVRDIVTEFKKGVAN